MRLDFGDCRFDSETRRLERAGHPVPLTPKAFALLELLIRERPRAVSKAQIRDVLWPETFVSDVNLAALVFEVRHAVGDEASNPRYVRTLRGFGYAFESEGRASAGGPTRMFLIWKDREFALGAGTHDIGRGEDVDVVLPGAKVSRRHARIRIEGQHVSLEDLGSKNGTFVRGERIVAPERLADGDAIRLGSEALAVRFAAPDKATESME